MARPPACRSPCQNPPPTGKDKLAGPAFTKGNNTYTSAPVVYRAPIPAPTAASALAPPAVNSTVRYSEADLQRIFRTVLETRSSTLTPQPIVFPDGPCERLLKATFPELYRGKTHMECYNFIQQWEDYFATAGAKKPNRVLFVATSFWEQALFRWQQHKAKNAGETDVPLIWVEFKAFLCWSLGKSRAFVDSIWRTIRRDSQYQQKEVMD